MPPAKESTGYVSGSARCSYEPASGPFYRVVRRVGGYADKGIAPDPDLAGFVVVVNTQFLDAQTLEGVIRKHSDFVSYPIKVAGKQVNDTAALWTRPRNEITDEQYNEFYKHLTGDTDEPLAREHVAVDVPIQFYSVLFIPKHSPAQWLFNPEPKISLNLHVKRVFIQDDCKELLPLWLRFVRGVVDCDDLPLNVSRENL